MSYDEKAREWWGQVAPSYQPLVLTHDGSPEARAKVIAALSDLLRATADEARAEEREAVDLLRELVEPAAPEDTPDGCPPLQAFPCSLEFNNEVDPEDWLRRVFNLCDRIRARK